MSWKKVRLGDIADLSNGVNFGKEAYAKGIKIIGVSNFGNRLYPEYESLEEIKEEVVKNNDLLNSGDIVFVRSNGNKELVGRCMLINLPPEKVTYSGFCIRARLKDTTNHDPKYWTYHFKNVSFRKVMSGTAVGANIQNLSQSRLSAYETLVPEIDTQKKIAGILSAYDNLIENNQKQIKLLEEAAQRLYKEWFVDLRFPGYEKVEVVDGVTEGWKKVALSKVIEYEIGGGWGEENATENCNSTAFVIRGTDLYGITHGDFKNIPFRYHSSNNLKSRRIKSGDIIFEVSGGSKTEGVAKTALINQDFLNNLHSDVICASFCKLVRPIENYSQYLYDTFKYLRASGQTMAFDKKSASSIVNYRWKDFLAQQEILSPCDNIIQYYNRNAKFIYRKIISLSIMIEKLKEARDRLLPKLMSGELEV